MSQEEFEVLRDAIVGGDRNIALGTVDRLKDSVDPRALIDKSLTPAMSIGKKFEDGEFFLSDMPPL